MVRSEMKRRAPWLVAYAILCALKFVLDKAQRYVEDKIMPPRAVPPKEPEKGVGG